MISQDDKRWCDDLIARVLSEADKNATRIDGYDMSVDIAAECYFRALSEVTTPNPNTTDEELRIIVEHAMDRALEYWDSICATLDATYDGLNCQRCGLIVTMLMIAMGTPQVPHNRALRDYLIGDGAKKYESRFITDINPGDETLTDEEIDELTKDIDQNLLAEFFECFAELRMFHSNAKDYGDDKESVEKRRKLLAIYDKILRSNNTDKAKN